MYFEHFNQMKADIELIFLIDGKNDHFVEFSDLEQPLQDKDTVERAQDVLKLLCNNPNTSDVVLKSSQDQQAKPFYCHKSVLSARSEVFKKMFETFAWFF